MSDKQDNSSNLPPIAYLSWRLGEKSLRFDFGQGRHLIGTTDFCAVRIPERDFQGIIATIQVHGEDIILKCVNETLKVRINGATLHAGESAAIGDKLDFIIGRFNFHCQRIFSTVDKVHQDTEQSGTITESMAAQRHLTKLLLASVNFSTMSIENMASPDTRKQIQAKLKAIIFQESKRISEKLDMARLEKQVLDEVIGLGPLEDLLADPQVTEIMVNARDQIFVEEKGRIRASEVVFSSDHALLAVIERIVSQVGRRVDASSPLVDARLLDGSRVNAVIPPIALKGPCLTIRRFSKKPIAVQQLVEWKSLTALMADFLKLCVRSHMNMMISGGTGSGKTTLLNALSSFIPDNERIITVEDAAELQLQQPHVVSLESRPPNLEGRGAITIRDLVKNCLRMRPDRIVVGECRGGEALDMLQAMNTGHDGSLTTAHANSPEDMLRRLETMVLLTGVEFPLRAIREQIASALHVIVQQTRLPSGRRLITNITWVNGLKGQNAEYRTLNLFEFKLSEGNDQGTMHIHKAHIQEFAQHFGIVDKTGHTFLEHGEGLS